MSTSADAPPPSRGRLFVAIDLDDAAREYVAAAIDALRANGVDARFTPREKWHATLAFLGPVERDRRPDVVAALQTAAACCRPFDLVLNTVGAFPDRRRPRVVWVGGSAAQPAFAVCANAVREALGAAGFAFENDAVPHVTVCRLKHSATPLPAVSLKGQAVVSVHRMVLYESIPAGGGTKYVPVDIAVFGTGSNRTPATHDNRK